MASDSLYMHEDLPGEVLDFSPWYLHVGWALVFHGYCTLYYVETRTAYSYDPVTDEIKDHFLVCRCCGDIAPKDVQIASELIMAGLFRPIYRGA